MEPRDLQRCFDYLIDSRENFLATTRRIGWDEFARDRGASWGSMLLVWLHMLDDEESWLQYAARGRSILEGPDRKADSYSSFDALASDNSRVGAATRDFLGGLTVIDLGREVDLPHGSGMDRRTVERIAMHAFVDELAHLGELVCLLWQVGVEPPFIDWLDFREEHTHES